MIFVGFVLTLYLIAAGMSWQEPMMKVLKNSLHDIVFLVHSHYYCVMSCVFFLLFFCNM